MPSTKTLAVPLKSSLTQMAKTYSPISTKGSPSLSFVEISKSLLNKTDPLMEMNGLPSFVKLTVILYSPDSFRPKSLTFNS